MKKIYSLIAYLSLTVSIWAQVPQKMSYQAVIRNNNGALITTTQIGIRISILQGSASGTAVYVETQTKSTNTNSLVSLEIGSGTPVIGTFSKINWATGPYFIKTETDPTGGTTYVITDTNELTSVPYALFSINASISSFTHYLGEVYDGGVIFELYKGSDGLEHGLIVAPTEKKAAWQTSLNFVFATSSYDGIYNTNLMNNSQVNNYLATLGTGWYLPSIDELNKLFQNRYYTQKTLRTNGNTLLSIKDRYWSSTEHNYFDAYYFHFGNGNTFALDKANVYQVRGIKSF
ncbi:MAG: DUF1566 domain-containing protein [Flavobacterium sp.]|nr:DUF1566 domain-containing protein [Flavobacterium sp.]